MSGTSFFHSPVYKNIMAKVYGIGAALVLAGALFKIQHYPGAGFMLLVGMGTEIVIFFLSAFEPPYEMPDWSLVFPELVGLEPRTFGTVAPAPGISAQAQQAAAPVSSGASASSGAVAQGGGNAVGAAASIAGVPSIDQKDLLKLQQGLEKLSTTANSLADISETTLATSAYTESMKDAANSIGEFAAKQTSVNQAADILNQSFNSMSDVSQSFSNTVTESTNKLSDAYSSFSVAMEEQLEKVSQNSEQYTSGISTANEKLSLINSAYELQLNSLSIQTNAAQELIENFTTIGEELKASIPSTTKYKQEVDTLAQSLVELNTIYGNMLSVMGSGGRAR